jgi:adenosylhomocysteine nucleosidase
MKARLLVIALWISALAQACQIISVKRPAANPPARVIVMSAFSAELEALRAQMKVEDRQVINGRTFSIGKLAGKDIVLVQSGVSMINAAIAAQAALDYFPASGVIFSGIAGGVNPSLSIGDVAVPARWGQYQEQRFARQTETGWEASQGEFGNFGMMFPRPVSVTREGGQPDVEESRFWFPVSEGMLAVAREAAREVALERCTQEQICLEHAPKVVIGGSGVSGPAFVDNAAYRLWVWQTFQADALDMESAAVAHVAYVNDVPFIAFRSLSDLAGGGPGKNEIGTFFELAAGNAAVFMMAFLEKWEP